MFFLHLNTVSTPPHWDGTCVLFEIADGDRALHCAVSRAALEEIGEERLAVADLLTCFWDHRSRLEAIALIKARARPAGSTGRVNLWAADMNGLLPGGVPGTGRPATLTMSA